jgi:hypothetical protein
MGFNYATANIGASHCYGYGAQDVWGAPFPRKVNRFEEGNADVVVYNQDHAAMNEIGIICAFSAGWGWVPDIYGKLLAASTGVKACADPNYLLKVGSRILNMERAFNIRQGLGREQDTLPARMQTENLLVDGVPVEGARVRIVRVPGQVLHRPRLDQPGCPLSGKDQRARFGLHFEVNSRCATAPPTNDENGLSCWTKNEVKKHLVGRGIELLVVFDIGSIGSIFQELVCQSKY